MSGVASIDRPLRLAELPRGGPLAPPVVEPLLVRAPSVSHRQVAPGYWLLTLDAPEIARRALPGQFAMLTAARTAESAPVLPRPMALYDWDERTGTVQILYGVMGDGTRRMATWHPPEPMTVVGPLGRGFRLHPATSAVVLVGRGIGTCSLTALARQACAEGIDVRAIVSARNDQALVGADLYRQVGVRDVVEVTDADGTSPVGSVARRLQRMLDERPAQQVFTCGSQRLLRLCATLARACDATVQVSLEAHMACGLGYCHGCSTGLPGVAREAPLVCQEGPVFVCA
ncbi:MAG: dihydroorotate oxidase electron transfer subunit [Nitriliruptorales bacterium]|nr:dihydroorotate oxidase electron transfer subunit [Nitriliruptorales bacterium]